MASEFETNLALPAMRLGEPAWAVAAIFPNQGSWSEADYFRLESDRFIELTNGCIEVLPMPTWLHQDIIDWLVEQLKSWSKQSHIGKVSFAPLPLRLFEGTVREPDVMVLPKPTSQALPKYPTSALLLMEVVSEGEEARQRDYVAKRADYAKAGIPEYWIVDPMDKVVTVLKLDGAEYTQHGRFEAGQIATSATLSGFSVACDSIWALEKQG